MIPKRIWLFSTLLFVLTACSSHVPSASVVPQTMERSQTPAVNPATSCIIVPNTVHLVPFTGLVAGASQTDAWDIGGLLLLDHFTGRGWHTEPEPSIPNISSYVAIALDAVTAIATNDVWISAEAINHDQSRTAFFLNWNGSTWTYVPSAPTLTHPYRILDVQGNAPNNVWAVVTSSPNASMTASSIQFERWGGSQWSPVTTYRNTNGISNATLQVFGTKDLWVSASLTNGVAVSHWTGSSFITTPLPPENGHVPSFGTIGGTADGDLWFISNTPVLYIALHKSVWAYYNISRIMEYRFVDILDFKPGYVLTTASDAHGNPALLLYNGYVRWQPTSSPWPIFANALQGAAIVKGTTSFWAGYYSNSTTPQAAVALVKCPSTPPAPL